MRHTVESAMEAVEAAVGSLVEALGLETFWNWIDWGGSGQSLSSGKNATVQFKECNSILAHSFHLSAMCSSH